MKAQSVLIVAMIFISMVILSIIPLTIYIYGVYFRSGAVKERVAEVQESMISESMGVSALFNVDNLVLTLINRAKQSISIDEILVNVICKERSNQIRVQMRAEVYPGQILPISLANTAISSCDSIDSINVYVVTSAGSVIKSGVISERDILTYYEGGNTTLALTTKSRTILPIDVSSNDTLHNITALFRQKGFEIYTFDRPDRPTRLLPYPGFNRGMQGGNTTHRYIWVLHRSFTNVSISIVNQTINNLWLGFNPLDPSGYNLMITCNRITLSSPSLTISNYTRIKIYGFRPSTSQGILRLNNTWITTPSQDVADYTFNYTNLTLSGIASRLEVYIRVPSTAESGYDPYVIMMNTHRVQGKADILYSTIDRTYGGISQINDGDAVLLDYSTSAFVLLYTAFPISNEEYSSLMIAVNYAFHDNEGNDERGTTQDLPIFLVGLVDENNNIFYYRAFTYRELARYEDTLPPTAQAQSTIIFIPLPPPESKRGTYYVFIGFQDPYRVDYSSNLIRDDVDFTLYLRSLELIPVK